MLHSLTSFIVALGILVFFHELGHYSIAKLCGVRVIRFSVGFGKPIFKWVSKKSGEEWTVSWIPLGGYVRMLDERDPDSLHNVSPAQLENAFNRKPVMQRIAIVLAGPLANLILASCLYGVISFSQTSVLGTRISQPLAGTLAAESGLKKGDKILEINGRKADDWSEVSWDLIRVKLFNQDLTVRVQREGQALTLPTVSSNRLEFDLGPNLPTEAGFYPYEQQVSVRQVLPDSPAQKAGFQNGDVLLTLDGTPIESSSQFTQMIRESKAKEVKIGVQRDNGAVLELTVVPEHLTDRKGKTYSRIGLGMGGKLDVLERQPGVFSALSDGVGKMIEVSVFSLAAMGKMLTGDLSWTHLSGPISIASAAGESSSLGFLPFVGFLAMVSVSLGILNLLPIPVLDGGHLMYYFAELLTGKPVSEAWMIRGQKIGLALIGALTCIAFFNDIQRLF
ncbi:RIP metalloprotease RseP [Limnobacter litoralis]|uniref:Zinc metalloprotease n=1 Tax=Limnobacter litoralis TaxID=481366 RepID=A0ABQ5YR00_9BURK|nr:RIP metalloprotease RseP [Limnobacter litoralis]GLR26326.1 zinc metalloprotease [Limnobacter litoralis]